MSTLKSRWRPPHLALGALAAVGTAGLAILGGCNSDDDGGAVIPTPQPTTSATATTTGTPAATATPAATPNGLTSFGPTTKMGDGTVRAFITTRNGAPQVLGIEMSEFALRNVELPLPGDVAKEFVMVPPPEMLKATPYIGVSLFRAPNGHPPAGNQTVPHVHPTWFTVNDGQRRAIGATQIPGAEVLPTDLLPLNHISFAQGYTPTLGVLFLNPLDPGYIERPFRTVESEYRFQKGTMVLQALGVADAFLNAKREAVARWDLPQRFGRPGYYPTSYHVAWDSTRRVWNMTIEDFRLFRATAASPTALADSTAVQNKTRDLLRAKGIPVDSPHHH